MTPSLKQILQDKKQTEQIAREIIRGKKTKKGKKK